MGGNVPINTLLTLLESTAVSTPTFMAQRTGECISPTERPPSTARIAIGKPELRGAVGKALPETTVLSPTSGISAALEPSCKAALQRSLRRLSNSNQKDPSEKITQPGGTQ